MTNLTTQSNSTHWLSKHIGATFRGAICVAVCFVLDPCSIANAQLTSSPTLNSSTTAPALKPLSALTPTKRRDAMYKKLAEEEVALTRQFSLLKKLVKTVGPSIAHIEAKKRQKSNATSRSSSSASRRSVVVEEAGSGVVVQYRGGMYVVTNYHVIESSEMRDISVEVGGKIYTPRRLMHDRETDLSVIGLNETDLVPCRLGNSNGVEIGDFVVAVGSPFGLSHSVSYGIISAMNRHDLDLGPQGCLLYTSPSPRDRG